MPSPNNRPPMPSPNPQSPKPAIPQTPSANSPSPRPGIPAPLNSSGIPKPRPGIPTPLNSANNSSPPRQAMPPSHVASAPRPAIPAPQGGGRFPQQGAKTTNPNAPMINEAIRSPQVRLISSSGEQLGIVGTREALEQARSEDLDLVVIGMQTPPVAKIMDYGKFKFEKEKEEKEKKKKSKSQSTMKEIKMSCRIDEHDLHIKEKWVIKWLEEGNKVRVLVQMKGREMQHPELARQLLQKILKATAEVGKPDQTPPIKQEGKMFSLQLAPNVLGKKA